MKGVKLHKRLSAILAVVALATAAALAPGASADPANSKRSATIPATCDGQAVEFVVNGNGDFTPGHVAGSTSEFIPESFDFTFEFTPTGGTTSSESASRSKQHPRGDVTCTIDYTETNADGTFHIEGTVTGFFTPASNKSS